MGKALSLKPIFESPNHQIFKPNLRRKGKPANVKEELKLPFVITVAITGSVVEKSTFFVNQMVTGVRCDFFCGKYASQVTGSQAF